MIDIGCQRPLLECIGVGWARREACADSRLAGWRDKSSGVAQGGCVCIYEKISAAVFLVLLSRFGFSGMKPARGAPSRPQVPV